ncbi:MAG: polysaccharide biosynthesis C-terminal domain-containing protein, partial [Bdellovibrionales bacterium]|nr:polysaccharide biosynthesis C-terminal domain-containing protein [Bdellovibrionales bacterium]
VSLGSALLPTLSKYWSEKKVQLVVNTSEFYLRLNLFLVLPASVGLFFLSHPIVEVLFHRGHFSSHDVLITSQVLKIWALMMIPTSCIKILAPTYYAVKNTWFPAVVSMISLILHISLAPIMIHYWGLWGLSVSCLLSACVNFILLAVFFSKHISNISYRKVLKTVLKTTTICVPLALVILQFEKIHNLMKMILPGLWSLRMALVTTILLGGGVIILLSHIFKFEEYDLTFKKVLTKMSLAKVKN